MDSVLTESNTPTAQGELVASSSQYWREEFLGRLRLDVVGFRSVVLPDSHLFDGAAFLDFEPRVLLASLARSRSPGTSPLVVKARAKSLEESLRTLLVRRDGRETLNGFVFKMLGEEDRAQALASALATRTPAELESVLKRYESTAAGVGAFLGQTALGLGLDMTGEIQRLARGWSEWLDAEANGLVSVEQWSGTYDPATAARRTYANPDDYGSAYRHLEQVHRILTTPGSYSSEVDEFLADVAETATEDELKDLQSVRDWEREVRRKALAMRHGVALRGPVAGVPRESIWAKLSTSEEQSEPQTDVVDDFIYRLGVLDQSAFVDALAFGQPEPWWVSRDADALHRTLFALSNAVDRASSEMRPKPFRQSLEELVFKSVGGVVGAVVGAKVAGAQGAAAGAMLSPVVDMALSRVGTADRGNKRVVRELTEYFDRRI